MTPIYLGPIIQTTAGDTDLMLMENLQEMATWESNGHVTDDNVSLKGQGRDPNMLMAQYLKNG